MPPNHQPGHARRAPVRDPDRLERDGFALFTDFLSGGEIDLLKQAAVGGMIQVLRRDGAAFGGRNLLNAPAFRELSRSERMRELVEPLIGTDAIAVRVLFFDKTREANWPVSWHQDLSLAVREQHDLPGWGPWSVKAGVVHVQPPPAVLATMLTVRLHLDDCDVENGPLRVLPGTHCLGRLSRDQTASLRRSTPEVACLAPAGSALLMRPLLLHASGRAHRPGHRRVIQIEFAPAGILPPPLAWAQ